MTVDGRAVPDMPARPVRLDELRDRLHERGCPAATRDAMWALLVHRARIEAGVWTIACLGYALPTLTQTSRRLCRNLPDTPCSWSRAAVCACPSLYRYSPPPPGTPTSPVPDRQRTRHRHGRRAATGRDAR